MKKIVLLTAICLFSLVWFSASGESKQKKVVTFSKDVAPILQKRCEECHHQGAMAPMSLVTYDEVRPWAKSIQEKVVSREMPPYHAAGPVGRYVDDPRLTEAEIETIKSWVAGGAVKGNSADLPAPKTWSDTWRNGAPDLIVSLPKPYIVKPSKEDQYVFILTDYVLPEETWVRGVEIRAGNRKVVHHANIHLVPPDFKVPASAYFNGNRPADTGSVEAGIIRGPFDPAAVGAPMITGWAPGMQSRLLQEGWGSSLPKGMRLAVQMHYAPTDKEEIDQTSVGFYYADGLIQKRPHILPGGTREITIPPGDPNFQISRKRPFDRDVLVRTFGVHMHVRGKSFAFRFHYPDGRVETVFEVPRYDFNWQRSYTLVEPIKVPKGTVVEYIATWDNSARNKFNPDPTKVVTWGEKTTDEMMGGRVNFEIPDENINVTVKKGRRISAPESTGNAPSQAAPFELVKQTLDVGMVVSDREKAREFYGEILGYKELPAFKTPDGGEMLRFQAGTTTLKLNVLPKTPPKYPGGTNAGIGFRLLTLIVADADRVLKNIVSHGQPEPKTMPGPNGMKLAFIQDPDGNQIELVGLPAGADAATTDRAQFGFTVSDVEKTREFYHKILGLPELEPKAMALMKGAMKYSFTAGKNTIKFWAGAKDLPQHTGRANEAVGLRYLTFMVKDVDAVHQLMKSRGARVTLAPFDFGGVARVMFIADPDGNYIEFAQLTPRAKPKADGNQ